MRKDRLISFLIALISAITISSPASAKDVEVSCKTNTGKTTSYLITTKPQSVRNSNDGEKYEILVFSPTKLVFKKNISIDLGATYYDTDFTYTINRSNLDYQVSIRTSTNSEKLKNSAADGTFTGKCRILPVRPVAF
jgi:hypothetical protein